MNATSVFGRVGSGIYSHYLERRPARIVLIDDDQGYRKIMEAFASSRGIALDSYATLEEMGSIAQLSAYDVAIVDYELGSLSGVEIAEYLPIFFGNMPLILISGRHRQPSTEHPWPKSIAKFLHKLTGCDLILDEALNQIQKNNGVDQTNNVYRPVFKDASTSTLVEM